MSFLKIVLIGLFFISAQNLLSADGMKQITIDEVKKHNSKESCWLVIDKAVFDVTKYLNDHPAPFKIMFKHCGTDASDGFATKGIGEKHSDKAIKIKEQYKIGVLK